MVQTVARKPDYSDLDLNFLPHPTTKDVLKLTGEDAIKRSVRNLILTNFYDRPFRSGIGSNVQKLLFDNITPLTANYLIDAINEVLRNYEPRITVTQVKVTVSQDNNGFDVRLSYIIINRNQPVTINLFLEKIR
jgi:phage baseplate assembly protein W